MSNFNEYFRKQGLDMIMSKIFKDVDIYSDEHKVTSLKYEIAKEPELPASYYIENKLTANHKVNIYYTLDGDKTENLSVFYVPREVDGAFIIEGRYRIPTNKLNGSYECRFRTEGSVEHQIQFDFNHIYLIDRRILRIKQYDTAAGIIGRPLDTAYSNIDSALSDPSKRELFKLTEVQSKKLMIKLDLDYKPEYITTKLIDECIAFGDDRYKDLIIDKDIDSVPKCFIKYLFRDGNGRNYRTAVKRIRSYFSKQGRLQDEIGVLTNLIARFWRGGIIETDGDKTSTELQVPPGVNAVNLESLKSKITISDTVAYNTTFTDIIDICDTPINQNVNKQNSLTVATHLTDDGVLYDVYDKNFNKITIDYLDYLNHKVCASDYIDYESKQMKPKDGQVEVKFRMKRIMVPIEEVELIDLPQDYRLSTTTRRIPFANFTDSVRMHMAGSMLKQSIPLPNAQRPLVDTGNWDDLSDNVLNEKFTHDEGIVKEITEDDVIIELPNGKTAKVPRRSGLRSLNDVTVFTEPKVTIGQKVKKGDIICGAHEIDKDTVKSGLNTTVLYHAYEGLVHEDAVVVSESYADRMASYAIIDLMVDIKSMDALTWIAPIGTAVKSLDHVVTYHRTNKLDAINQALQNRLGLQIKDATGNIIDNLVTEQHLLVPNNIEEAVVSDVMVQENIERKSKKPKTIKTPDYTWSLTSANVIKDYEKNKDRKVIYDKYPEYIASDTLDPIDLTEKTYKVVYTVRVRLIKKQRLVVGSKLTNRYGGKGVISVIEPDEKMPILVEPDGTQKRVEIIMNPYSTINRKIPSVISEVAVANCCIKIHDNVEKWKVSAAGRKKIMPLINKYYPGKYDKMSVEEFINLHNTSNLEDVYSMKVGCFSKYTPETIQEMMDDLGVSTKSKVLMPKLSLCDLDEIKEQLGEEEYNKFIDDNRGKFEEVDRPLMAGSVVMEQLYHMPMYSNKVTSDMQPQNAKIEPIAGRGRYRKTGQSIGEMELSALLSRGNRQFIGTYRGAVERERNQRFLNNLLGLGLTITDNKGYAQGGSNLKSSLQRMKTKYKFKNGGQS